MLRRPARLIDKYHLDLSLDGALNPRDAFGSHDDADHVYNTPRGWYMLRYFNPNTFAWDARTLTYAALRRPAWCMVPEKKITPEDVKYVLSSHYQARRMTLCGHGFREGHLPSHRREPQ